MKPQEAFATIVTAIALYALKSALAIWAVNELFNFDIPFSVSTILASSVLIACIAPSKK